jgi:hypothetical protein
MCAARLRTSGFVAGRGRYLMIKYSLGNKQWTIICGTTRSALSSRSFERLLSFESITKVNLRRKSAVCRCLRAIVEAKRRSRFYQWFGQVKYSKRISRNVFCGDRVSSCRLVVDRHTHANLTRLTPASASMTPSLS